MHDDHNNLQPVSKAKARKKPYLKPEVHTEDIFESKGLACTKLPIQQDGSDCGVGNELS